jgi:hypothetical protein
MKTNIHFWSYLAQFFLEWEIFQTKFVEKIKTHILCSVNFFSENRAVYKIIWKNVVERGRPQTTIWRMRIACWVPKATDTRSDYVIFIAFPLQQWLRERASVLHYTYIACVVSSACSRWISRPMSNVESHTRRLKLLHFEWSFPLLRRCVLGFLLIILYRVKCVNVFIVRINIHTNCNQAKWASVLKVWYV